MASTLTVDNIEGATTSTLVKVPGHVINSATHSDGTQISVSSTGVNTIMTMNYTPVSSTSKLHIHFVAPRYSSAGGTWGGSGQLYIYQDGVQVWTGEHDGTITNEAQSLTYTGHYVSGNLTAGQQYAFSIRYNNTVGYSQTTNFNRSPRKTTMTILEIED